MTRQPRPMRPKIFPPPEFPPRKPRLFARTPPAIFPVILGLLGLGLALRRGLAVLGLPGGLADLALGIACALWAFSVLAYAAKIARRPGAFAEDLRVLPGRAGIAASTMGGMATAAALAPTVPAIASFVLMTSLLGHAVSAIILVRVLSGLSVEAREINPTSHQSFVGFIVGAIPAASLGHHALASTLFWATLPVALLIWAVSLHQLWRRAPPAPLRPLLAIHLAPASLFALVALMTGQVLSAQVFAVVAAAIALALLAVARWIAQSGFSPIWGSLTFPLAALASALLALGGVWELPGVIVLIAALGAVPLIAWQVLRLWPGNRLAVRTNASEA